MRIIDLGSAGPDDPIYKSGVIVYFRPSLRRPGANKQNATDGTSRESKPAKETTVGMDDPAWMARTQDLIDKRLVEAREAKKAKLTPSPDTTHLPRDHADAIRAELKTRFPNLTDEELDSGEIF